MVREHTSNHDSVLPPIQPHTKAKHEILEYHLNEWFPILGRVYSTLQYIDGFAGPGEYQGGEPGSPIIALDTVRSHRDFAAFADDGKQMQFLFVEKDPAYYRHLREKVAETPWPSEFDVDIKPGEFEPALTALLDDVAAGQRKMPPTLLFIDPFGSSGFSMELLERLAAFARIDVLINLNHAAFVQWILPDEAKHVTADRLYGGPRWRPALRMGGQERADFLVPEYEAALREIGWRGTSFEMVNKQNQTAYHLVFGTRSPKGMEAIKRAMRRASPTGEFRYTDRVDPAQPILLGMSASEGYPLEIADYLYLNYKGREVSKQHIIDDVITWHRRWLEHPHLTAALRLLEDDTPSRISNVAVYATAFARSASGRASSML